MSASVAKLVQRYFNLINSSEFSPNSDGGLY